MTDAVQRVLDEVLKLSLLERAELIEALFRRFDTTRAERIDALWEEEVESRIDAYEAGGLAADSVEDMFDRILRR